MFQVFLETSWHQNLMRPRWPAEEAGWGDIYMESNRNIQAKEGGIWGKEESPVMLQTINHFKQIYSANIYSSRMTATFHFVTMSLHLYFTSCQPSPSTECSIAIYGSWDCGRRHIGSAQFWWHLSVKSIIPTYVASIALTLYVLYR